MNFPAELISPQALADKHGARSSYRSGGIRLHPSEVDPGQRGIKVSAFSRFRHYTNLERCESRQRRVLVDFPLTSTREAAARAPGRVRRTMQGLVL